MKKFIAPILLLFISISISAKPIKKNVAAGDTAVNIQDVHSKLDTFHYQASARITLGTVASLDIPKGFKYLDGGQAAPVLHNLWKNPYSESLGMLLPEDKTPFSRDCWAVDITYEENGHVKDNDAKDLKYNELLKQMQQQVIDNNPERIKQGGRAIELIGWAEPPYYDAGTHKLYWAKKLKDAGDSIEFLNYNIRILGRKGVLVLNAIGGIEQLAEIKEQTPTILAATNFTSGNTYGEFNSSIDKVAAYGIAGLIAGGILAKTGLFAKLGIFLFKFLKPLLVAISGFVAWVMRIFRGRKEGDK
jgi:uncharacterized membrane-anchored protein